MSQLDLSIVFSHFSGFLICLYGFMCYFIIILIRFWCNDGLRELISNQPVQELEKIDNSTVIKRIFNL